MGPAGLGDPSGIIQMNDSRERLFEADGFKLGDLIGVLDEGGIVWGKDFVVKGHPGPDVFELLFENEVLAVRAEVLWNSQISSQSRPASD